MDWGGLYFAFFNVENLKVLFLMSLAPFCPGCVTWLIIGGTIGSMRPDQDVPLGCMLMLIRRSGGLR